MMGSFWAHFLKSNSKDNWRNRHSVVRWQIFRFLQVRHRSTGSLKQIMRVWLQIRLTTNMAPIIGSTRTPVMLDEEVSTSGISHTSGADAVTGSWSLPHWLVLRTNGWRCVSYDRMMKIWISMWSAAMTLSLNVQVCNRLSLIWRSKSKSMTRHHGPYANIQKMRGLRNSKRECVSCQLKPQAGQGTLSK